MAQRPTSAHLHASGTIRAASRAQRSWRITPIWCLRSSIGLCFFWFGALKFVPGLSPAEVLAERTIAMLTLGFMDGRLAIHLLAALEVALGVSLISGIALRFALWVLMGHMVCTLTPLVLFPQEVFTTVPFGLTLVGQYIVKNGVIMSGAWLVLRSAEGSGQELDRRGDPDRAGSRA